MWNPGDILVGRGVYRNKVWTAVTAIVIKDTPKEIVTALLPGAECRADMGYAKMGKDGKRRWDFIEADWKLTPFLWGTYWALAVIEADKFHSIRLLWQEDTGEFMGYYVNFQLPFKRSHCGIDTLDLELDIVVNPDLSFEWKDLDDYQRGIEAGIILPEWVAEVEIAKTDILQRIEKRLYPFDGSWLDWRPDPTWAPPKLPENWDKL